MDKKESKNFNVVSNLDKFLQTSDLIITNRMHGELISVSDKVFTRDLSGND